MCIFTWNTIFETFPNFNKKQQVLLITQYVLKFFDLKKDHVVSPCLNITGIRYTC